MTLRKVHAGTTLLILLVVLATVDQGARRAAAATTIFVDAAAGGAGDGTSWADAYPSLQSALAAANGGDQVWVAIGTYRPTTGSDRTLSFVLKTGVVVYGGFLGGETSVGQRDVARNRTTLTGDVGADGTPTDNSYHVVSAGSVGSSAVLDGFTIRAGYANAAGANGQGGGLYITSGSPTLTNVRFTANLANSGGGLYNESGDPTLTGVAFSANTADAGGGLYNESGEPTLADVTFFANSATGNGGGLNIASGAPRLGNVTFVENSAYQGGGIWNGTGSLTLTGATLSSNTAIYGGGLYNETGSPAVSNTAFSSNFGKSGGGGAYSNGGDPAFTNVTFAGNSTGSQYGGGLYNEIGSLTLTHATFTHNRATSQGGGVYNYQGALSLRESVLWGNKPLQFYENDSGLDASLGHNVIAGGCPPDTVCSIADTITADPLLSPAASNGGLTVTAALKPGSSAIDAGTPAICATVAADQRGVARPVDGNKDGTAKCDLGAFEYIPPAPVVGFATATSSATESATTVTIAVKLSTTAAGPVTVKYKIANGTAKSPSDYTAGSGTVTIPALTTTKNLTFTVVNDRFDEPNETVVLTLSAPTGATLGTATHTYTIKDDDARVVCRGRIPTIVGTAGNDTLVGTKGPDVIAGLDGNDTITGNGGDDVICGGPGNDTISGGNGNDVVRGDAGNDTLLGDGGSDLLSGGAGKDKLEGGANTGDSCDGGPGVDALLPKAGCESLTSVP